MEAVKSTEYVLEIYNRADPEVQLNRYLFDAPFIVPQVGEMLRLTERQMEIVVTAIRHEMGVHHGMLVHFIRLFGEVIRGRD